MKKILFILAFVYTAFSYGQGGPKVDAVKYKGDVTTAVRNLIDVPVGETWLVWDVTLSAFYYASSDDVWNKLIVDGAQTTELFQVATQALNKIEVGIDGPTGGTDYVRISGGETSGQAPLLYITDNRLAVSNYDNTDIDAVGATSLITKAYGDANYGSGGITDGDKGEIVVSGGVWSIDTDAVSLGNMADNSITAAEIVDASVIETDLNISNTPTVNYALTSDGSTGFTWTNPSSFIGVGSILEDKLNIDNAPTNNYILAYNQPSLNFKWVDPATLGGGSSLPVDDTTSLVQDPVDGTKEMRIDVGAVSTATTRTLTMPDADVDLGNLGAANLDLTDAFDWTGLHSFSTQLTMENASFRWNNATSTDYWTHSISVASESPAYVYQSFDGGVFNAQYTLNFSGVPANATDLVDKAYVDGLTHTDDQTASEVTSTATGNVSATNVDAAIAELASEKINTTISGRTGTAINSAQLETEAQIASNGAVGSNELVICSDCSPAEVVATATIAMDGWKMYDDQTADAATITLSDCDPGETLTVYINRASAPTLAGTGLTFNQLPNTTAFASATQMMIIFEVAYDGTTIDYYYVER